MCSSIAESDSSGIHDASFVKSERLGAGDGPTTNSILDQLGVNYASPGAMSAGGDAVVPPVGKREKLEERDGDVERLGKEALDGLLMPPPDAAMGGGYPGPRPTAASLGLKESIDECLEPTDELSKPSSFVVPSGMMISSQRSTSHQLSLSSAIMRVSCDYFQVSTHQLAMSPLYDVLGLPCHSFPCTFPCITDFAILHPPSLMCGQRRIAYGEQQIRVDV